MKLEVALFALPVLFPLGHLRPLPPSPAVGGWTTGSTGALGDVVYGPGAHVIDLATEGVYDPVNWVVVFDYQTLTVQAGATISFANHPTRAPVVMRAPGDVVIDGTIVLDGAQGHAHDAPLSFAEPGPGGFRGGQGKKASSFGWSAGHGPGGGYRFKHFNNAEGRGGNGSHLTLGTAGSSTTGSPGPLYGSPSSTPLIGGSGGGGTGRDSSNVYPGAGAGGGAILIGSDTRLLITGTISARGGPTGIPSTLGAGNGSGGTIRLVAPEVRQTAGTLDTRGGVNIHFGGDGIVRVEAQGSANVTLDGLIYPDPPSVEIVLGEFLPSDPARVALVAFWDPAAGSGGEWIPITQDPLARIFHSSEADVQIAGPGLVSFRIEGHNVPLGAALHVRTTYTRGQAVIDSSHTMGEVAGSTLDLAWTDVALDLTGGVYALQVRAELP